MKLEKKGKKMSDDAKYVGAGRRTGEFYSPHEEIRMMKVKHYRM